MNINIIPKEQYDTLLKTTDREMVRNELCKLEVKTTSQALVVSLTKWDILSRNTHLGISGVIQIGIDRRTCGLCSYFMSNCDKCCNFTGLQKDKSACFEEFYDWVSSVKIPTSPQNSRNLARDVHDVLYDCYKKHMELNNILTTKIQIIPSRLSDLSIFYTIRYDPDNIKNFKVKEMTSFLDHTHWFKKNYQEGFYTILEDDCPVGYIRINEENEISIGICSTHGNKGIGAEALTQVLKIRQNLIAEVYPHNINSLKLFRKFPEIKLIIINE